MAGKIYVVGLGPGDESQMTPQAKAAIADSDVIVGYDLYVELIKHLIDDKQSITTGMKKEVDRCEQAFELALDGKTVSMVCSGDSGIYGMAGIVHEIAESADINSEVEVIVIPGITAACSAAAVLGAPLIHDFAVISLSDLLTPWEKIEKRLELASDADFVICLYNPSSKKRHDYLRRACEIMLKHKSPNTHCGYVRNVGREGQRAAVCSLSELMTHEVDMFTTVIVGNSQTRLVNGKLVTPRGYRL